MQTLQSHNIAYLVSPSTRQAYYSGYMPKLHIINCLNVDIIELLYGFIMRYA